MTMFSPGRLVPVLFVGVAAYMIVRAILDSDDGTDADSLPEVVKEARERVIEAPRVPSEAGIGALGELARVVNES